MPESGDVALERCLLVGPGPRLALLRPLLGTLRDELHGEESDRSPAVRELDDPEGLLGALDHGGVVVLDADAFPLEDLGLARRFLERRADWTLLLTGDDPRSRVARFLLGRPGVRWVPWPLDVEDLLALVESEPAEPVPAAAAGATPPELRPEPHRPEQHHPERGLEEELAAIESILRAGRLGLAEGRPDPDGEGPAAAEPAGAPALPTGLDLTPEELAAFLDPPVSASPAASEGAGEGTEPGAVALAPPPASSSPPPSSPPPSWYRAQVANLADLAQRLDLSLRAVRESVQEHGLEADDGAGGEGGIDAAVERLGVDLGRLVQFARTLGYLAAPPRPGEAEIALATLVEEQLGGLAGADANGPRYLFREEGEPVVRSDKTLLVAVFDALLAVARSCSGSREVVRVSVERDAAGPLARVRVSFPAGPLADVDPAGVLEPYGLRRTLPQIGANALAAASRILEGQGGRLALGPDEPKPGEGGGRLAFEATLPARG